MSNHVFKHINLTYLDNLVAGDIEFKKKIMGMFIEKTPAIVKSMQMFLEDEDWPSLKGIAHKFKSSVDFVGSKELAQSTIELEKNCERANKPMIEKEVGEIDRLCKAVYEELKIEIGNL